MPRFGNPRSLLSSLQNQRTHTNRSFLPHERLTRRRYVTSPLLKASWLNRRLIITGLLAGAGLGAVYITDTRASVHGWLAIPLVRSLYPDAEDAHEAGVKLLKALYSYGLNPRERGDPDSSGDLSIEVFGHTLDNPLGIAAGLDKHGDIPDQLLALGPAVVECGGITPLPQEGNPKPRVFRIPSGEGMINRYGLNSCGAIEVAAKLKQRVRNYAQANGFGSSPEGERAVLDGAAGVPPGSLVKGKLMAIQVAKNESTPDGDIQAIAQDYVNATKALARYADIITVNVSCPNAPGFRELQQVEPLTRILRGVVDAADSIDRSSKPAVMVKVSPDEDTERQIASICVAVWASGVDGVIVGNTTKKRPDSLSNGFTLSPSEATVLKETGGYSGPQFFDQTLKLVRTYRRMLDYPLHEQKRSAKEHASESTKSLDGKVQSSLKRDYQNLKEPSVNSSKQPLLRVPERHKSDQSQPNSAALSASHHMDQVPPASSSSLSLRPKTIFCTGSITSSKQALQVLEAGASVAQIYTALVYNGVGKITSMKQEMRQELRKSLESDVFGQS